MPQSTLTILAISLGFLAFCAAVWAIWMLRSLNTLRKNFFAGSTARDLESVINDLAEGLRGLQDNQIVLQEHHQKLRSDFAASVQKVGLVKFNPFSEGGGNLSFSIAILDGKNTGFVLTSMHGREQNRVYTKQISNGKCEIELTGEELKAIELAENYYQNIIS